MKRNVTAVAGLILGMMVASTAEAQMARPVQFGLGAGISIPRGEGSDFYDNGYHFQGMLGFRAPMFPVGLRLDVMYHTFEAEGEIEGFEIEANDDVLAGTLNAMFELGGMMASPYLTGGIGMYNIKSEGQIENEPFDESATEFGLNGGAGIKFNLAGFGTFLEARYHHIMTEDDATAMIPITFGIMF